MTLQENIPRLLSVVRRPYVWIPLVLVAILVGTIVFRGPIQSLITNDSPSINSATGEPLPPYKGRPLTEIRDNPDAIKLYNKEQLDIIHQKIVDGAGSINVNPDNLDPWLQVGLYKHAIGDNEGARDAWAYAGILRPKNIASFKNLGDLYWHDLPDFLKSEQNYRRVIENDPTYLGAYVSLSELYRYSYLEKAPLAEQVLFEALEVAPEEPDLIAYIARFYAETDKRDQAVEYYQKLRVLRPEQASEIDQEIAKLRRS